MNRKYCYSLSFLFLFFFSFFATTDLKSQSLSDYVAEVSQETWTPITGGTAGSTYAYDEMALYVPLSDYNFNFKYDGVQITDLYMNAYGSLSLNSNTNYTPNYPYSSGNYLVISGMGGMYLYDWETGMMGDWSWDIITEDGNRVFVAQWLNMPYTAYDGNYPYQTGNVSFQIRLYENSGIIKIVCGPDVSTPYSPYNYNLGMYLTGDNDGDGYPRSFINVEPTSSGANFYYNENGSSNYLSDNSAYLTEGTTFTFIGFPVMKGAYPASGSVLTKGNIYTPDNNPTLAPGILIQRVDAQVPVYVRYKMGRNVPESNPEYSIIYTAVNEDNENDELVYPEEQPVGTPGVLRFTEAKGVATTPDPNDNGYLDLLTNQDQIRGGEYWLDVSMEIPDYNYVQKLPRQYFNIALPNDLAVKTVLYPKPKGTIRYPLTASIPVNPILVNYGIHSISSATCEVKIYQLSTNTMVYDTTETWQASGSDPAKETNQTISLNFPGFRPDSPGDYRMEIISGLTNATDDDLTNNTYPRNGETMIFNVADEVDLEAVSVIAPGDQIPLNRPILPQANFRNWGVTDIVGGVDVNFVISKDGRDIYNHSVVTESIPNSPDGIKTTVNSDVNFIPTEAGTYTITVSINSPDDPNTSNNTVTNTFTVSQPLNGTYTIGTKNQGQANNYKDIQSALNDLYFKGVSGPVVYELTDAEYNVGNINRAQPAIDLSSKIIGVSSTNTITFRPSADKSNTANSILINMYSGNGYGVYFGQNTLPSEPYATIYNVTKAQAKSYANGAGYIIFDGGNSNSLQFVMYSGVNFKSAFYLGNGASNITLKNLNITDGSPSSEIDYAVLPNYRYNAESSKFEYDIDIFNGGQTYSSGITLRSISPYSGMIWNGNNLGNLDTLVNKNNLIQNNSISGFGFGIVSLGAGNLKKNDNGVMVYTPYYNTNNTFASNKIYNIGRAGIFLGFENKSTVSNNKIYNVLGSYNTGDNTSHDAYGILLGGQARSNYYPYNNVNITLNGNEISSVSSSSQACGIVMEQGQNTYPLSNGGFFYFPTGAEKNIIANNIIWGLNSESNSTNRAGIYCLTSRNNGDMLTPASLKYRSNNIIIVNNTIRMQEDNHASTGYIAGIALQQMENSKIMNNAISMEDLTASNDINTAIFEQGKLPEKANNIIDRNAYYLASNNSSIHRLIEINDSLQVVDYGTNTDFLTLENWQVWSKQDRNSVVGDFVSDFIFSGLAPNQQMRIKTNPAPVGSILDNRAMMYSKILVGVNDALSNYISNTDIDNNVRGLGATDYDIGACEFAGLQYLSDIAAIQITAPAAYQSANSNFSDAQYIMTTAPVDVKALLRNEGNINQQNVLVNCMIYRQLPNGDFDTAPILNEKIYTDISSYQNTEVSFKLADHQGTEWVPETYSDLSASNYTVPKQFSAMSTCVTPLYKIVISLPTDQNNFNNEISKVVRFFIQRSALKMLVSAENTYADLSEAGLTAIAQNQRSNIVAGKLNSDSLVAGLNKLGWLVERKTEPKEYDFDIFDRTSWEPKAVDYTMYRSLFWADGDDKSLTLSEKDNISKFLTSGKTAEKKNLVVSSQEMVRANSSDYQGLKWLATTVMAKDVLPSNPLGAGVDNSNNSIIGMAVNKYYSHKISATQYSVASLSFVDAKPYPALVSIDNEGEGISRGAFYYANRANMFQDSLMGIATSSLYDNIVYLGLDWRHYAELETLLRALTDFIDKNNGNFVPVELVDFDAVKLNNTVSLSWQTASEQNSDRFVIERAVTTAAGTSLFEPIAEEQAAGKSNTGKFYGPIIDKNVELGNTYIYKLKMIDKNGDFEYSKEKQVEFNGQTSTCIASIVPNIISNTATINYYVDKSTNGEINVYDMAGNLVSNIFKGQMVQGGHEQGFDVLNIPDGTYSVVLSIGNTQIVREIKIIK